MIEAGVITAGIVSGAVLGVIVSFAIAVALGIHAWNETAIDNAVTSLKTFRDNLIGNEEKGIAGILGHYAEGDTIYISVSSTFLAPDELYVGLYNDSNGWHESKAYFREETGVINKAGSMLINMLVAYGSQFRGRDNPIRHSTSLFSTKEVYNHNLI